MPNHQSYATILVNKSLAVGMHLADASIFIACSMALAVFDIIQVTENGKVLEPKVEYTSGTIR